MAKIWLHPREVRDREAVAEDAAGRGVSSKRSRCRLLARLALVGSTASVAAGALGVVSGIAPFASAAGVRHTRKTGAVHGRHRLAKRVVGRVVAGLAQAPGSILHVAVTGTETRAAGKTASWSGQSWTLYPDGGGIAGEAFRQLVTQPAGPNAETAITGRDTGRPQTELYDPATNTIYTGAPTLPADETLPVPSPPPTAAQTPPCMAINTLGWLMLDSEVSASGGAPAASVADVIAGDPYLGPAPLWSTLGNGLASSAPLPWAPDAAQNLKLSLSEHCATVVGYRTIDGRNTVEIDASGAAWTYYADASSYEPVELDLAGVHGSRLDLRFDTYEQLPAQGNSSLLSLTAQHPTATIDTNPTDYQTAQARLFPTR